MKKYLPRVFLNFFQSKATGGGFLNFERTFSYLTIKSETMVDCDADVPCTHLPLSDGSAVRAPSTVKW
jgi:hypothetical protein